MAYGIRADEAPLLAIWMSLPGREKASGKSFESALPKRRSQEYNSWLLSFLSPYLGLEV